MLASMRSCCLGLVACDLVNQFGIEVEEDDLYWAIFLDANCDVLIADAMIEEFIENPVALSIFAQTLGGFGQRRELPGAEFVGPVSDFPIYRRNYFVDAIVVASILLVGLVAGSLL